MKVIKPPTPTPAYSEKILFLAGSIEMGKTQNWQKTVEEYLKESNWTILNPRRDDWNNDWIQSKDNPQFREQVEWELAGIQKARAVLFYFDPATMSPITLMELGIVASQFNKYAIVVCPDGFWRKGNVDIVCDLYNVPQAATLEEALKELSNL